MGQWDILEFLGENAEGWFTARQIAEQTDQSFSSVLIGVRRLRKSGMVEFKRVPGRVVGGSCFRRVLAYLEKHESIRTKEYARIVGVSSVTAVKDLNELVRQGKLRKVGRYRGAHYTKP